MTRTDVLLPFLCATPTPQINSAEDKLLLFPTKIAI